MGREGSEILGASLNMIQYICIVSFNRSMTTGFQGIGTTLIIIDDNLIVYYCIVVGIYYLMFGYDENTIYI